MDWIMLKGTYDLNTLGSTGPMAPSRPGWRSPSQAYGVSPPSVPESEVVAPSQLYLVGDATLPTGVVQGFGHFNYWDFTRSRTSYP